MQTTTLTILGCGSALPTRTNFPSCQLFELRDKQYMIDCGEGAQIRMRQMGLKTARLGHIFISHLHGDHCFGLIGLISSFGMLGRTAELHIHAHTDLENILTPQLQYFCEGMSFDVIFHAFDPTKHQLIFEDRTVSVFSIPLKHRIPCCGFLFEEKARDRNILRDMIDFYNIPVSQIPSIKKGADFTTTEGEIIPNNQLTTAPTLPKRYAYCADTAPCEKIIPYINGIDCLYHEATFGDDESLRAKKTKHSTARQAAEIAKKANVKKLIIGHLSARYSNQQQILKEAKQVFENTILGEDTSVYEI